MRTQHGDISSESRRAHHRRPLLVLLLTALALTFASPASPIEAQTPPFDVMEKSIRELQAAMEAGEVTSLQLTDAYLARIAAYDDQGPSLNAMISMNPNARQQAMALDAERDAGNVRGPLHGIPMVLKDNYDTFDLPTQNSSLSMEGVIPPDDAFQVARLRDAGVVILGKTNMHEFARGIVTVSSLGGQTLNPYNTGRNPGGSSGGTGAGIAANFAAFGMGSDTCGSIRIPSSHNSLVGLRQTRGLASRDGIIPLALTQDVGGALARNVEDLAIVMDATVGYDPNDPVTALGLGHQPETYVGALQADALQGARIGYLTELFGPEPEDREVAAVVDAAVDEMRAQGATVVPVTIPGLRDMLAASGVIGMEFRFQLETYLQNTPNAPLKTLQEIVDSGLFHESLTIGFNNSLAVETLDTPEYRAALLMRDQLRIVTLRAMADAGVDALVYPTITRTAVPIGESQPGSNCRLSAHTGLPAISVPGGFTPEGMPVGVELLGRPFGDAMLLGLAYSFEQATHHRRPPASTPVLAAQ